MVDYCYHTHTYRCGHARGTEEEYVLSAIEKGYKVIGFTDHVFLPFIIQEGMRGNYEELDDYINTINHLKEKYKDKIEIHLGFECEYGEDYVEYYRYLKQEKGVEYLILGQHLFFENNDLVWLSCAGTPEEMLEKYSKAVVDAINTGLFTYIAHPDLFIRFFSEINPFVERHIRMMCEAAKNNHIPFEINLGALRDGGRRQKPNQLTYPDEGFFKIVKEYDIPVIIGIDAHDPRDFDPLISKIEYAQQFAKDLGLKLLNRIDFKE